MATTHDYYDVLGVSRDATADDIKRAYRQRARESHPDISEDHDAEERFKSVNEAYEVLSDPQRREMYDRFGTADPRAAGYGDPFAGSVGVDDIFSMFFGGGFGSPAGQASVRMRAATSPRSWPSRWRRPPSGADKELTFTRDATCATCGGSGAAEGGSVDHVPRLRRHRAARDHAADVPRHDADGRPVRDAAAPPAWSSSLPARPAGARAARRRARR